MNISFLNVAQCHFLIDTDVISNVLPTKKYNNYFLHIMLPVENNVNNDNEFIDENCYLYLVYYSILFAQYPLWPQSLAIIQTANFFR